MSDTAPRAIEDRTSTASFVLSLRHIIWIEDKAKRNGKNKSEFLRDLLDRVIEEPVEPALVGERVA